jgi:hypothetical protein
MRLLNRLWPSHHRREIDELSVVFGVRLGPDRFHRLDPLAHQLEASLEGRAVVFDLLGVPAPSHAEKKPSVRYLIDRGDQLCGLDRIALHDEADAGTELQRFRHRCRYAEHDERVHDLGILFWQVASTRKGRAARCRYVRMLGRPH